MAARLRLWCRRQGADPGSPLARVPEKENVLGLSPQEYLGHVTRRGPGCRGTASLLCPFPLELNVCVSPLFSTLVS